MSLSHFLTFSSFYADCWYTGSIPGSILAPTHSPRFVIGAAGAAHRRITSLLGLVVLILVPAL